MLERSLGAKNMLYKCNKLSKVISPSNMSIVSISLYINPLLKGFVWNEVGGEIDVSAINPSSSTRTYILTSEYEYWNKFENVSAVYGAISPYYYVTDNDYYKLVRSLSPNDLARVVGVDVNNLYHPSQYEGIVSKPWKGSCYGMSS